MSRFTLAFLGPLLSHGQDLFLSSKPDVSATVSPALITDDIAGYFKMNGATRAAAELVMTSMSKQLNEPMDEEEVLPTNSDSLERFWLDPGFDKARCLDGTPYAYYFRPAPTGSAHAKDWVIYLQGGGVCVSLIDCTLRGSTRLGSSYDWNQTLGAFNMVTNNATLNPFWDFNHVILPYCTGDTHTGTDTGRNAYFLFFAGHLNLEASFTQLQRDHHLGDAQNVIFSGASAGGIGCHNNADWVQSVLPSAKVVAMPFAGMFFPARVEFEFTHFLRELHLLAPEIDINRLFSKVVTSLWASHLPAPCATKAPLEDSFRCWDSSYNYNYIEVPTLFVQNMFDQYQLQNVLFCPNCNHRAPGFVGDFGAKMRSTLGNAPLHSSRRNSVWLQACYDHTKHLCFEAQVVVQNQTLHDVASKWYFEGQDEVLMDACADSDTSTECNEQCGAVACSFH